MSIDRPHCRQYLRDARFAPLFIEELGWDRQSGNLTEVVDGQTFILAGIAHKRGLQVYTCAPLPDGHMPDYPLRRKIEAQVTKAAYEHLIIYVDAQKSVQTWQWARREAGQSTVCREHIYHRDQPGDSLLQKLEYLAFSLDEEEQLSLPAVTARAKAAFDVEKLTKRFYDRFKTEHTAFLQFLTGIPDDGLQRWYASVLVNRLMFIYFIQKKGFLNRDIDYLRRKLAVVTATGPDRFYRDFLCPLFFEGFAKKDEERPAQTRALLGDIPYLDGGLFQKHQIEEAHGEAIQVPDASFQRLFRFFDEYQWNLEQRPSRPDNEINPDVLGYIFEKYINQKEMGAYYTKEDITGYICRNTILPRLLNMLAEYRYAAVTPLPVRDIEPYIYPTIAQEEYLPTETDREYAARRARMESIRADFAAGKIASIDDFITYNLDIERFAQDWVRELTDPLTLRAFYFECLTKVTVLDPTVGSGAFLFAAMNILEALYEACLDKMEQLRDPKYPDFQRELSRVAAHPNRRYFILKSIVVNNLYGVDIMEEATEICKLRLFLKLVAQLEPGHPIEPLPDIDFNIRAGNSLVGYATKADLEGRLFFVSLIPKINEVDAQLRAYRELQTTFDIPAGALAQAKEETRMKLREVEGELNEALSAEYGAPSLSGFVATHHPFHWYVDFNAIMLNGGFDAVVGNPPYVEYSKVRKDYQARGYESEGCGNLYAFVAERCLRLTKDGGRFSLIVPLSMIATDRMAALRNTITQNDLYVASFDMRPSSLFEGVAQRLCIFLTHLNHDGRTYTAGYRRWFSEERPTLITSLSYIEVPKYADLRREIPKLSEPIERELLEDIRGEPLAKFVDDRCAPTYVHRICRYFIKAVNFLPLFLDAAAQAGKSEDYKEFHFIGAQAPAINCFLNSSLFYWYWRMHGDGFHCGYGNVYRTPFRPVGDPDLSQALEDLESRYMKSLHGNSKTKRIATKKGAIQYQEFYPKLSKPLLDAIDAEFARHYGFTDEQLDFIVNYDIKYRMGQLARGENGEED